MRLRNDVAVWAMAVLHYATSTNKLEMCIAKTLNQLQCCLKLCGTIIVAKAIKHPVNCWCVGFVSRNPCISLQRSRGVCLDVTPGSGPREAAAFSSRNGARSSSRGSLGYGTLNASPLMQVDVHMQNLHQSHLSFGQKNGLIYDRSRALSSQMCCSDRNGALT